MNTIEFFDTMSGFVASVLGYYGSLHKTGASVFVFGDGTVIEAEMRRCYLFPEQSRFGRGWREREGETGGFRRTAIKRRFSMDLRWVPKDATARIT